MIHIAVCDDDLLTTELVERLILDTQKSFSEKIDVSIFTLEKAYLKPFRAVAHLILFLWTLKWKAWMVLKQGMY